MHHTVYDINDNYKFHLVYKNLLGQKVHIQEIVVEKCPILAR